MHDLLKDPINIELARLLCSGFGVEINISELSRILNKHRNTIDSRIDKILNSKIIDLPYCPFKHLQTIYPLMVIEKADFPRDPNIMKCRYCDLISTKCKDVVGLDVR